MTPLEKLTLQVGRGCYHNALQEQLLRATEALRNRDTLIADQARRAAEEFRRYDRILADEARGIPERLRQHDASLIEQAARLREDLRRQDSLLAQRMQSAIEGLRLYEHRISERAREMLEPHRRLDVAGRASLGRQIAAELQISRKALQSISLIGRQARDWAKLIRFATRDVGLAHNLTDNILVDVRATWATGINSVLEVTSKSGLWARSPEIGARMAALPAAYSSFCDSTIRELSHAHELRISNALKASMNLAQQHLAEAIELIPFLAEPSVETLPITLPRPLRLYVVQQTELLESHKIIDPHNAADASASSPAAITAANVLTMLRLIPQVNSAARLTGREEIFKPTTKMMEALLDLTALVPTNKAAFSDFVDCLYWLFYEGAGCDKLRYLRSTGGPLEADECGVIWIIKSLRNKWCRHDPDHGDPAHVRRSYQNLREALQHFGLRHLPRNAEDYRRIQVLLISELIQFLNKLMDRLV